MKQVDYQIVGLKTSPVSSLTISHQVGELVHDKAFYQVYDKFLDKARLMVMVQVWEHVQDGVRIRVGNQIKENVKI